jgi:CDP-6-deoxy-D-xylo-4-hexulose-3-dehydrase
VRELDNSQIECRPIVTGNFLKNKEVLEHFDYTISGELEGAEFIDSNGLFVGNHHENLVSNLDYLKDKVLSLSSKLTSK